MNGGRKAVALDAVTIGATESEVLHAGGKPDRKTESESKDRDRADWTYTTLTLEGFRHHGFKFENGRVVDVFKR